MKKVLFLIILLIPFTVSAKNMCSTVSGTGTNVGDEIKCGDEYFYILENDGNNIKALAKYNLYVGSIFHFDREVRTTTATEYSAKSIEARGVCTNLSSEHTYGAYYLNDITEDGIPLMFSCYYEEAIETNIVKQSPEAIGKHGDKENPSEIEAGVVHFNHNISTIDDSDIENVTPYNNYFYDFVIEDDDITTYLNGYKTTLQGSNLNVKNIDMVALSDLDKAFKKIPESQGKEYIYNPSEWITEGNGKSVNPEHLKIGSFAKVLPEKYSWLWGTTYWTRTFDVTHPGNIIFIDTLGDICSTNYCNSIVGAGIRPVITISADEIDYKIQTKTDGNGTVIAEKVKASSGDLIKFTVEPKPGFVLGVVKVTDSNGNTIEFTDYSFTMPSANVTIEATFLPVNPKTGAGIKVIYSLILFGISVLLLLKYFENKNEIEEV